jgi:hypothetical protein
MLPEVRNLWKTEKLGTQAAQRKPDLFSDKDCVDELFAQGRFGVTNMLIAGAFGNRRNMSIVNDERS